MATQAVSDIAANEASDARETLLCSVAEQLKMPLMYIARQAELYKSEETIDRSVFGDFQTNADMALRLVDSYLLGLDLATKRLDLQLEPVSISATLYDVAHELTPLLHQKGAELQLVLAGKYGEVMAHKKGLMAAMYNVGAVLTDIETSEEKQTVKIVAHHSPVGIIAGMYLSGQSPAISLAKGRLHHGTSRQPFAEVSHQTGAGIFVADAIFASMHTKLRMGRFRGSYGLAATLQPNRQMQFV